MTTPGRRRAPLAAGILLALGLAGCGLVAPGPVSAPQPGAVLDRYAEAYGALPAQADGSAGAAAADSVAPPVAAPASADSPAPVGAPPGAVSPADPLPAPDPPEAAAAADPTAPEAETVELAALEAAPAPPIEARPGDLVGLDGVGIRRLLGAPGFVRTELPARVWQYAGPGCILDLYLYPEAAGAVPRVVYYEVRGRGEGPAPERCFVDLLEAARSP